MIYNLAPMGENEKDVEKLINGYISSMIIDSTISVFNTQFFAGKTWSWTRSTLEKIELLNCKSIAPSCFRYNYKLKEVILPECTYIGLTAFYSCYQLEKLFLPKCKIIKRNAFDACTNLTELNLPVCEEISDWTFQRCGLIKINIPKCQTIGYNGFRSNPFEEIELPNCNFIDTAAFESCTNLKTVKLLSTAVVDINYPHQLFEDTNFLENGKIYVPASLLTAYSSRYGLTFGNIFIGV